MIWWLFTLHIFQQPIYSVFYKGCIPIFHTIFIPTSVKSCLNVRWECQLCRALQKQDASGVGIMFLWERLFFPIAFIHQENLIWSFHLWEKMMVTLKMHTSAVFTWTKTYQVPLLLTAIGNQHWGYVMAWISNYIRWFTSFPMEENTQHILRSEYHGYCCWSIVARGEDILH